MSRDPLQGCIARVDRAEAHFQSLRAEMHAYNIHAEDEGSLFEADFESKGNVLTFRCTHTVEFPISWSLWVGDVMHNLHSALDNLVWALGNNRSGKKNPPDTSAFPIVLHENEWFTERVKKCLLGVGPQERALIEAHQPFMRRNPFGVEGGIAPKHNVLARIKNYSNWDKHRVPTLLAGIGTEVVLRSIESSDCDIVKITPRAEARLQKGAVLMTIEIAPTGDHPQVEVVPDLGWFAGLENGEPISVFLALSIAYVRDLLEEFRPFFEE